MDEIPSDEWWHIERNLDWPPPKNAIFERIVGAVLVQNTSWNNNASGAVENLKKLGVLEPSKMLKTNYEVFRNAIKPAGFMDRKSKVLREIAELMTKKDLGKIDTSSLRKILLDIGGIGPETSDVILLYAFNRPIIPISTSAKRILERFCGLKNEDYGDWQIYIERTLPKDVQVYKTFHALILEFGQKFCIKIKAKCGICIVRESCIDMICTNPIV